MLLMNWDRSYTKDKYHTLCLSIKIFLTTTEHILLGFLGQNSGKSVGPQLSVPRGWNQQDGIPFWRFWRGVCIWAHLDYFVDQVFCSYRTEVLIPLTVSRGSSLNSAGCPHFFSLFPRGSLQQWWVESLPALNPSHFYCISLISSQRKLSAFKGS